MNLKQVDKHKDRYQKETDRHLTSWYFPVLTSKPVIIVFSKTFSLEGNSILLNYQYHWGIVSISKQRVFSSHTVSRRKTQFTVLSISINSLGN